MNYDIRCDGCNILSIQGKVCHETGCDSFAILTKRRKDYIRYNVVSLDVWGNKRDGYEVNDASATDIFIIIPIEATIKQIIQALKRAGYVYKLAKNSAFNEDSNSSKHTIWINHGKREEPFCELRAC